MVVGNGDETAFGRDAVQLPFRKLITHAHVFQDVLGKVRGVILGMAGLIAVAFVDFQYFHHQARKACSQFSFEPQHTLELLLTHNGFNSFHCLLCNKGIGNGSHLAGRRRKGGREFGQPGGTHGKGAQAIVGGG